MLHELIVPREVAGERLDVWLESQLEGCTRSLIARLIKQGNCAVTPGQAKAGYALRGGEKVSLDVPDVEPMEVEPEDIPLIVLHEDEHLIAIDKPAGMVVHPAVGNVRGTLVNALLGRYGHRPSPGGEAWRPGIVHRLDAHTSGVIVVARTPQALVALQAAFKEREVGKRYLALAAGKPRADFLENAKWLARSTRDFRKRVAVAAESADAKEAYTSFVVLERREGYAALEARPRTGRTHQIRVHLADLGHPVLADAVYGRADHWPLNAKPDDATALRRHALHAWTLDLPHPAGGRLQLKAPIPADLARWVSPAIAPRPR
jgi:23S rRNA pseudouridine1911/1915/1917 synthase